MEGIFKEFENENGLRSYPFAACCVPPADADSAIPEGVFVDASIFPVNPYGTVYLSGVSEGGKFTISDDNDVIMEGYPSGDSVEFYDLSGMRRHAGTLVASSKDALDEFAGRGYEREYGPDNYAFAANCLFPVVLDGVTSVSVGGSELVSGDVSFSNGKSDDIRVSSGTLEDGKKTIRFDVVPRPVGRNGGAIKRIVCVVDGQTPFRMSRLSYNVVMLQLDGIDKSDICSAAHRENNMELADTCECEKGAANPVELPESFDMIEVYIPPDETGDEGGIPSGAENAFFLVVPNVLGYDNPISITLEDGVVSPNTEGVEAEVNGQSAEVSEEDLQDNVTSKGVVIQVPGLSGGQI